MSDDERRLEALARRLRVDDGLDDPEWDALVADELPSDQREALRRRPPVHGAEEAPFEVFRPFDSDERAALADAVLGRLDGIPSSEARPRAAEPGPGVVSARVSRPWVRVLVGFGLAAALAAGVGLALRTGGDGTPLGPYHLVTSGGDATHLGAEPTGELRLAVGSRVAFRIEPDAPVDGALAVEAFIVAQGEARTWNAPVLRRAGGLLVVEGTREALFEGFGDGSLEVVFVVSRPESMPSRETLLSVAAGGRQSEGEVEVLRARVLLVPGPHTQIRPERPRLEVGGCGPTREGCELREGSSVVVWADANNSADVRLSLGGQTITPGFTPVDGGLRFRLTAQAPAILRVSLGSGVAATEVAVALESAPESAELRSAIVANRRGDWEEAERHLRLLDQDVQPVLRLQALRQRARIALRRADPEAEVLLRRSAEESRRLGRLADEADDRFALAYHLLFGARQIEAARQVVEALEIPGPTGAETDVSHSYFLGLVALESGNLRDTLPRLTASARGAERLGMTDQQGAALEVLSEVYATLGRYSDSTAAARSAFALLPEDAQPCERARGFSNLGWALFRASGSATERDEALARADSLARAACPAELGHVLTNRAIAEHASGRLSAARRALEEARRIPGDPNPRDVVWWRSVEARIELEEGQAARARSEFAALAALGERALLPEAVFEGNLGEAESLVALGDEPAAREAFRRANGSLASWAAFVPLGEGREGFLGAHRRLGEIEMGALLKWVPRSGDPEALLRHAMTTARTAASRTVGAFADLAAAERLPEGERAAWLEAVGRYRARRAVLEEHAAWVGDAAPSTEIAEARTALQQELERARALLSAGLAKGRTVPTALRPAAPGEVQLGLVSLGSTWVTLAVTEKEALSAPLRISSSGVPAEDALERLDGPIRAILDRSTHVRVVSDGPGSGLDVHRLALGGEPLFANRTVSYGLDVDAPADAPTGRVALLVIDPNRDAPGVRAISETVAEGLARAGLTTERMEGADVTHAALRAALERPEVELLFYGGHAVFEGHDGALAGLRLAGEGRLTVSDILALSRVPRHVVLLACDAGRTESRSATGLGIAQAFLLRGAESAVAAPRPVQDAMTARLGQSLAAELGERRTPVEALHAAQAALYREHPEEVSLLDGWASFRAWSR